MTYRPTESAFGPPFVKRIPSLLYLALAIALVAVVLIGEHSPPSSALYEYVVLRDMNRVMSSRTLATLLLLSAIAAVVRASMRGVRIRGDGLEYRDIISLGFPRVRRYKWAQIDRIILDQPDSIAIDLWDGSRAWLPVVGNRDGLAAALEKVAAARAIPVRGGAGLDEIPESGEFGQQD
jgi:hypothetical protein